MTIVISTDSNKTWLSVSWRMYAFLLITITEASPWKNVLYAESSPFFYCTVEMECDINHEGSFEIESSWYTAAGGLHSLLRNGKMRTKEDDQNFFFILPVDGKHCPKKPRIRSEVLPNESRPCCHFGHYRCLFWNSSGS